MADAEVTYKLIDGSYGSGQWRSPNQTAAEVEIAEDLADRRPIVLHVAGRTAILPSHAILRLDIESGERGT